jgi:hypothetical protein
MRDEVKNYISFVWCRFRRCPHRFAEFTCTQSYTQTYSLKNRKQLLQVRVSKVAKQQSASRCRNSEA